MIYLIEHHLAARSFVEIFSNPCIDEHTLSVETIVQTSKITKVRSTIDVTVQRIQCFFLFYFPYSFFFFILFCKINYVML